MFSSFSLHLWSSSFRGPKNGHIHRLNIMRTEHWDAEQQDLLHVLGITGWCVDKDVMNDHLWKEWLEVWCSASRVRDERYYRWTHKTHLWSSIHFRFFLFPNEKEYFPLYLEVFFHILKLSWKDKHRLQSIPTDHHCQTFLFVIVYNGVNTFFPLWKQHFLPFWFKKKRKSCFISIEDSFGIFYYAGPIVCSQSDSL